jgi:predicted GTPase
MSLCDKGQTGLGKSTLINTIFASHLIDSKGRLTPNEPVRSTTEIQTVSHSTSDHNIYVFRKHNILNVL